MLVYRWPSLWHNRCSNVVINPVRELEIMKMKQQIADWNKRIRWNELTEQIDWVIEQGIAIQQIPAPTFSEKVRAEYVARQFKEFGLQNIEIDDLFNVIGLMKGKQSQQPGIMVSAHTD